MGNIDVIKAVFESYGLIKKHYNEVALPLVVLLILSGAGHLGSNWSTGGGSGSGSSSQASGNANALMNALSSPDALAGLLSVFLGVLLLVLIAFVILAIIAAIVDQATWFYVYEHFYAILRGKKLSEDWKSRMKRHSVKAIIIGLFWLAVAALVLGVPLLLMVGSSPIGWIAIALGVLVLIVLAFFLLPMWVYFAMDGMKIGDAMGKSFSLVSRNIGSFLLLGFIMLLAMAGQIIVMVVLCCFAFIVGPLLQVFFALLWGITLMKMKLALEK